jgi:hypothetical protein
MVVLRRRFKKYNHSEILLCCGGQKSGELRAYTSLTVKVRQTKLNAQQRAQRLHLYGLVQGLSYVVRLNDLKTAQHLRAKLAWVLRRPHNLAKPLHDDVKELFVISGLWVRNAGNRHDTKLQIRRFIRRIVPRLKIQRWRNRRRRR